MVEEKVVTNCKWCGRNGSPRMCFWLGALAGALIIMFASLAYIGYLYVGGAFNLKSEIDLNLKDQSLTLVEQAVEPLGQNQEDIKLGEDDYIYGNKEAQITLAVYTDFECQLCRIYHKNLITFVDAHQDKVNLVIKNFVLTQKHPEAYNASMAAICAGRQDKYYEFASQLFSQQSQISGDFYLQIATEQGLDTNEFELCQNNDDVEDKIDQDYQEGLNLGVNGIPNTVVLYPDGSMELIDGNVSQDFLQSLLKEYI